MTPAAEVARLLEGFRNMAEQSLAGLESAKADGRKVVGVYCIFAPLEIIRAAGAVPVGLCGKRAEPIAAAEADLPANLCPLIKSSYGYALTAGCPFFSAADAVVAETTCDGKKKMYELLQRLKPLHLMHLPHTAGRGQAEAFWMAEIDALIAFLEALTGRRITEQALRQQIRIQNRVRRLMAELHALNALESDLPLSGMDLLVVMEAKNFWPDAQDYARRLEALIGALRQLASWRRPEACRGRILLTGTPIGKGSEKVLRLIEEAGAVVVAMENCTSLKSACAMVDEDDPNPLKAIARRYLALPCACMTPNTQRPALLQEMAAFYRADGVVDLNWHACHTYLIESKQVALHLQQAALLPMLHICTDYGENDRESLRTRIEAFLEML